ncbi:unnamed protein product, partial [Linum tenue]
MKVFNECGRTRNSKVSSAIIRKLTVQKIQYVGTIQFGVRKTFQKYIN